MYQVIVRYYFPSGSRKIRTTKAYWYNFDSTTFTGWFDKKSLHPLIIDIDDIITVESIDGHPRWIFKVLDKPILMGRYDKKATKNLVNRR